MNVIEAIQQRQSIRAYQTRPVAPETIYRLLEAARHAPSGVNSQPWQVAVVSGQSKLRLQQRLEAALRHGEPSRMEYPYYPASWQEPYKARRLACGLALYGALGIERDDKARQLEQRAANFRAFDAPVMLLFFIDPILSTGSYLDYGMFLQSLMVAAVEAGLATCPQASLADYPQIVKEELGYDDGLILVCGMALGYAEEKAEVNRYRTAREPVESFARFFE
ncbi:MAG: nitroreductase family protein [Gammaproteobacteria bacterium]|nr:nitroreductase family protein [Gammaproteobacteria bacterium]